MIQFVRCRLSLDNGHCQYPLNPFTTIHDGNFRRHSSCYVTIHDGNFSRIYYSYTRFPVSSHALRFGSEVVRASNLIKYSAWEAAISATASCGVGVWYRSLFTNLFSFVSLISVDPFLGATTIGAHHSVGSVTGLITPSVCLTLSRYGYWMALGAVRKMVYYSPPIQYEIRP